MSAAILATDEEWSIISSSDLEEHSGNTSDAEHESGTNDSSKQNKPSIEPFTWDAESVEFEKSIIGTPDVSANMESTIVPRESPKVRDEEVTQNSQTFQSIQPHLNSTRSNGYVCDYTRKCSSRIASRFSNCEENFKFKSRAVFQCFFGSHLAKMKQRATSEVPLSFLESFTLDFLLFLENSQDYFFVHVLLFVSFFFAVKAGLDFCHREFPSTQMSKTFFSQQYDYLKHTLLGPGTNELKIAQRIPKVLEDLRVILYLRAKSIFQPKSAVVILDDSQSNWLAKFWSPFRHQEPQVPPVSKWHGTYWGLLQKEFLELRNTCGKLNNWRSCFAKLQTSTHEVFQIWRPCLSELQDSSKEAFQTWYPYLCKLQNSSKKAFQTWYPYLCKLQNSSKEVFQVWNSHLFKVQESSKEMFQFCRSSLTKVAMDAGNEISDMSKVLQERWKSGVHWEQYLKWTNRAAETANAKFQEYTTGLSNYATSKAWNASFYSQYFGRAQQQLDEIAKHSYLTMNKIVQNLRDAWIEVGINS